MIQKAVHKLVKYSHPWRTMRFDELAELYTSMTMRALGFSLIGIFVPVYLYKVGVSLPMVFVYFGLIFALRIPISFFAGRVVARVGPKHTIALSTVLFIVFLSFLLSYTTFDWPIWVLSLFFSLTNGFFFIAYNVDFSKIKHNNHVGKELGWLIIFERIGSTLGPVVGGILAATIAPEATIVLAILVLLGSLIPLFMSGEPVRTHQEISYKGINHKAHIKDYLSLSSLNVANMANGFLWPLLMAVFILTENTYAHLGIIISIALAVSIFSAKMYGLFIDKKHGLNLMQFGLGMNVVLSISRALVSSSGGALAASALGEPVNLAYKMPLAKGFYDTADSLPGKRIAYIVWVEAIVAAAKGAFGFALALATLWFDPVDVLRYSFFFVAIIGLGMLVQRFPALKQV